MGVNIDARNIRDLANDFGHVPSRATRSVANVVGDQAKRGTRLAQTFARSSAGDHGHLYPRTITSERRDTAGLSWVYGPDSAMPQGGMSFEFGSRNQPPHLDLNRSADIIGPTLAQKVMDAISDSIRGH
jgi:hypothetical protein